jgi:muramidase (phage lysozyme)
MDADRIVAQFIASESATLSLPPNVLAGLSTIRSCEGTNAPDGYRALFGYPGVGCMFSDLSEHPNIRKRFVQTDGVENWTTAAGAYQLIFRTWDRLRLKLQLTDFTPASQDAAAIALICECGVYEALVAGQIRAFIDGCAGQWASLPASHYPQPKRTLQFAADAFELAGGVLA